MSSEFFDELVEGEDAPAGEALAGLRRVHDLLVSASPPPSLPPRLERPPRLPRGRTQRARLPRLRLALAGVAAAGVASAFAIGYSVGHGGEGFQASFTRPMHGVGALASARASIWVGRRDASGNWPLEMTVRGLPALPHGAWYDLYLTKRGQPDVLCGTFRTGAAPVTRVRLNAPSELGEYTGWIVTAASAGERARVLLTT